MTHFDQLAQKVVREFLGTVVIVDDRARITSGTMPEPPHPLVPPGKKGGIPDAEKGTPKDSTDRAHQLDAKKLIDSFASFGIVCAVLRPSESELASYRECMPPIAESCDAIVIDWVLHQYKQGEMTMKIIGNLLKTSQPDRGRARLILIYTGEEDLNGVADSVRSSLNLPEPTLADDPFTIQRGAARICIYAKEQARLPNGAKCRRIDFDKLPQAIVAEFAHMTRGLLSNVALRSLAELRANTYQLLKRFHCELDAPYVTHSTLLGHENAANHLVPLIVSEIQALLEDKEVANLADRRRILQWLRYQRDRGLTFELPQHTTEKEYEAGLRFLLKYGVSDESLCRLFQTHAKFAKGVLKSKNKAQDAICDDLTKIVTIGANRSNVADDELAALMLVRSQYSSPTPVLALGCIVLETNGKHSQYLLCVQPRCDSVRLSGERAFPFLPMKRVADNQNCDFIIENKGKPLRLLLKRSPFEVRMVKFAPAKGTEMRILAYRRKGGRFFKASGTRAKYQWVADLKTAHAQRVANQYAYQLSRVGLTESEWLRVKWLPRKDN